jgi:hypothetical protein
MTDVATLFQEIIQQSLSDTLIAAPAVTTYDGSEEVIVFQGGALKKDAATGASAAAAASSAAQAHDYAVAAQNSLAAASLGPAIVTWLLALPTTLPTTAGVAWLDNGVLSISQ